VIAPLTSGEMVGQILGAVFFGFAIALFIASMTVDSIGMRRLHVFGICMSFLGVCLALFADADMPYAFDLLWAAFLLQGLGWGAIEAALHPLIVSIYPKKKVERLSFILGAYSLGMITGAVTSWLALEWLGLSWKALLLIAFIPKAIALTIIARVKYPPSERVMHEVSYPQMAKSTLMSPLFYLWLVLMGCTAITENLMHFLDVTITNIAGFHGYWLIGFIHIVHFSVKMSAGTLNRQLGGSAGILAVSCAFACLGLIGLRYADGPISVLAAAFLFGMGTALFWPTTLAGVSERLPAGGPLAIGLVATAGILSSYLAMPVFGRIFDLTKVAAAGGADAFEALAANSTEYIAAATAGSRAVFEIAAFLPGLALIAFTFIWLKDRRDRRTNA